MIYRLKTTTKQTHYQLTTSDNNYCHQNNKPNDSHFNNTRTLSQLGSESYQRSLRRSFSRSKLLAFFNPDLNQFITLTYAQQHNTPQQVQQDIKYLIKQHNRKLKQQTHQQTTKMSSILSLPEANTPDCTNSPQTHQPFSPDDANPKGKSSVVNNETNNDPTEYAETVRTTLKPFKYIYVMEYQKRGSIHVHMIANDALETVINKNGYPSIKNWSHGFSSVLTIKDFDNNFKPYLYLFKYMHKAQRIGASFIHTSRNFDEISSVDYDDYIDVLREGNALYQEDHEYTLKDRRYRITKQYIKVV